MYFFFFFIIKLKWYYFYEGINAGIVTCISLFSLQVDLVSSCLNQWLKLCFTLRFYPNWFVHLQMYPFMFLCVVLCCEVCVVMFCPGLTVVCFWKWCMYNCVILEAVIFWVCVVCVCVMWVAWSWYEICLGMLSDMIIGAWLWKNLIYFPFCQNIDILITPQYGFKI